MYYGDYNLAKDRADQIRAEVQHNRLEAALAKNNHIDEADDARKSLVARGATLIAALIR